VIRRYILPWTRGVVNARLLGLDEGLSHPAAVRVDIAAEAFDKVFNIDVNTNNWICPGRIAHGRALTEAAHETSNNQRHYGFTAGNWQWAIGVSSQSWCAGPVGKAQHLSRFGRPGRIAWNPSRPNRPPRCPNFAGCPDDSSLNPVESGAEIFSLSF